MRIYDRSCRMLWMLGQVGLVGVFSFLVEARLNKPALIRCDFVETVQCAACGGGGKAGCSGRPIAMELGTP